MMTTHSFNRMMPTHRITYHYQNGMCDSELGFLEDDEDEPDVTKLQVFSGVTAISIDFSIPIEHELILKDGCLTPRGEYPFQAHYYVGAQLLSYEDAVTQIKHIPQALREFDKQAVDALDYGVKYAGYDVNAFDKPLIKKEELLCARLTSGVFIVMSENAAILCPINENSQKMRWKKISPMIRKYGLV